MAAGLPLLRQILVDQLAVAHLAEAREMAAMHDRDIEIAHGEQRLDIVVDVGVIGVVDQRAVIDDVAGQQDAGLLLVERDAAGRMAGRVDRPRRRGRRDR